MTHSRELAAAIASSKTARPRCLAPDWAGVADAARAAARCARAARDGVRELAAEERIRDTPTSMAELMQRAGTAVGHLTRRRFPEARRFTVVCGSGSNGGDGRIAADWLRAGGADVTVVDAKPEDEEKALGDADVIVDAVFGTGSAGASPRRSRPADRTP